MLILEPRNMEETSTENAKISDSGYSNTCSNSQSHTSSGSSVSRNSNRSASSGYHGGNPSTFGSCTETLPKPIAKRKEKGYKKKKSKNASSAALLKHVEASQIRSPVSSIPAPNAPNAHVALIAAEQPCKPALDKKTEEVAVVELVDVTDPGVHNDNNLPSISEAGLASKTCPIDESSLQSTEEYHAVISMHDGLVLHATPSLHASLGYPKDSWTGQLFIDFLDPKDKHIFSERIASEIAISRDFCQSGTNGQKASIFCRLRRFNATLCTSAVNNDNDKGNTINYVQQQSNNSEQYVPYRISMVVQNFNENKDVLSKSQVMLLIVSFQPVRSAYKVPKETVISAVFTTRHTASCRLSYVDPDVVQYLGYLPQDMIDHSLFDFYHPEDLPLIKDIYETVINLDNSSYKSKPYRYIVQNGCCVVLETEWSSFVNPWTKNLEFIIGHHRVLKGPADPNVFRFCSADRKIGNINEEVLKEAKIFQKEIRALLVEGVQRKRLCQVAGNELLSKKEFDFFVENILQEIKSPAPIKDHMAVDDRSFSEHDSVMLGEISPHHEYFDSKSSTETPPSYNQLNYHDNIERFFNSNIGTSVNNRPYGSDEENLHSSANSSDEPGKNNAPRPELQCTSSTNGSGNSGSAENLSSESNNRQSFGSGGETSNATSNSTGEGGTNNNISSNNNNDNIHVTGGGRFKPPILTESLLNRHNEDMEKLMVQKHREQKKGDKRNKSEQKANKDSKEHQQQSAAATRCENGANKMRLKRSGSQSREGDNNFKILKRDDSAKVQRNVGTNQIPASAKFSPTTGMDTSANINKANLQWPPISVSMPSATTIPHQCFATPNACSQARMPMFPQMFPVYYLLPQPRENPTLTTVPQEHPGPPNHLNPYCYMPVPYMATAMPSIMYPPIIGAPAPTAMMYRSFLMPEAVNTATSANVIPQPACPPEATISQAVITVAPNTFDLKRPASRATSDKAEPGSTMAMSESSKKIFSPSGIVSSCMSNEGNCYFSSSINKSCDSSSNTDQQHTSSSFESQLSLNQSINQPKLMYHKSKDSRANQTHKAFDMVRKEPPWIEGVKLTPELIYQYQIGSKSLSEVLKADLDFLRHSKQPSLVNDQLGQLFLDLDIKGYGSKLILEEAGTNSASDSSSDGSQSPSRMGAW